MAMNKKALQSAIALAGVSAFALTACTGPSGGGTSSGGAAGGGTITYGTTDKVVTLDPAGSYDAGSFMVMNQIYPFLLNSKPGTADSTPDIAESASFTSPTEYTVKLKSGLKFANGHALTSSDVKFSIDRVVKINDDNGPASLLGNLDFGRSQGRHHRGVQAQGRQRPGLPGRPRSQRRTDRRRRSLPGRTS